MVLEGLFDEEEFSCHWDENKYCVLSWIGHPGREDVYLDKHI